MSSFNDTAMAVFDNLYALIPQPRPVIASPAQVKIVAHRGLRKGPDVFENSLGALTEAASAGLYGVEFDIRWTADNVPVVCHDPSPTRLYPQSSQLIVDTTAKDLARQCPQISTLEEVVHALKGKIHLFIELKEPLISPQRQDVLQNVLDAMVPIEEFHVMTLEPEYFEKLVFLPAPSYLPIATWNLPALSKKSLEKGWAGVTGHFFLLSEEVLGRHHEVGQGCGTGFINSKNLLFRELNRGMDWIFTDRPLEALSALDQ